MLQNEVILRTLLLQHSLLCWNYRIIIVRRSVVLRRWSRREGHVEDLRSNDFQPDPIYTPSNLDFDQEYTLIPTPWTPTPKSIAAYRPRSVERAIRHGMRATNSCLEFKLHRSPHASPSSTNVQLVLYIYIFISNRNNPSCYRGEAEILRERSRNASETR